MKHHILWASVAALTLAACASEDTPVSPKPSPGAQPAFLISDAAHSGATAGFYFLPPMVPKPNFSGTFDFDLAGLAPTVSICPAQVLDCGSGTEPLAVFTPSTTPAVRLHSLAPEYQVVWKTTGWAEGTYRIHVEAGAAGFRRELGFADVKLRLTAQAAKSETTNEYIGVKIGSALPISFRIETGIVGAVGVVPATATIDVFATQQDTATVSDLHGSALVGRAVAWTYVSNPPAGVVASIAPSAPTDASGQTMTTVTAGAMAGTATITASAGGWFGTAGLTVNGRAYIANDNIPGSVTVIRVPQNTVVATVLVGSRSVHVAITPDGRRVYVSNLFSNSVSVIDVATNTVVATVGVGVEPGDIRITPDGAYAYLINFRSFTVSVIATASNTVVATIPVGTNPAGIAISPDGLFAYVTNYSDGTLSVISTASRTVVATVPAGTTPRRLAITPDGAFLYITNETSNLVSVLATATNSLVTTIGIAGYPCHVAMTPSGAEAYVTSCQSNTVAVVATAGNTVVATISSPTFSWPNNVAFTPDGALAYVTNRNNNTAYVINTQTRAVTQSIATGVHPGGLAITP